MSAPYPWLEPVWRQLTAWQGRPPGALLIAGPRGIGKLALARAWAQALLCGAKEGAACGECPSCRWFAEGTHPDFLFLTLEERENQAGEVRLAQEIDVAQARRVVDFVRLSSHQGGWRVVLVHPADALNRAASNALLKVLEEGPINTVFMLVSDAAHRLLATLRSRCRRLDIGLPPRTAALAWLEERGAQGVPLDWVGGAPLRAMACEEQGLNSLRQEVLGWLARPAELEPTAQAETYAAVGNEWWFELVYRWLLDLLACHLGVAPTRNPDFAADLGRLGRQAERAALLELLAATAAEGRVLRHPLNAAAQREAWLMRYRHMFGEKRPARVALATR